MDVSNELLSSDCLFVFFGLFHSFTSPYDFCVLFNNLGLTAANKLQRRKVIEDFATEFEEVKKKGIF